MKILKFISLLLSSALLLGISTSTLNASSDKCGAGKCGSEKKMSSKCGSDKNVSKCGSKKTVTPAGKCGKGKCS